MTNNLPRYALALAAALMLPAQAQALVFRAYLSSTGTDNPSCALATPCRLLPAALAVVASEGEVWLLVSANYNIAQVDVTRSVTILAVPGALGSVVATNGSAIRIATAGVEVTLRNLVIVPLPGANGLYGISMTAGAALTVDDCLIANHSQSGIAVTTAAVVRVTDSTIRDNGYHGLWVENGARASVTRAIVSGNGQSGVYVSGTAAATLTTADIADSTLEQGLFGLTAWSQNATAQVKASVRASRIVRNTNFNILAQGGAFVAASDNLLANAATGIGVFDAGSRVWASGNTVSHHTDYGIYNSLALLESAGDNAVRNNATNAFGTITAVATR
jgi:hypothetical protein